MITNLQFYKAGTNENESNRYKGEFGCVFRVIFELADEQALLEKPIELKAKGMPDVIPTSQFAATALKAVKDDFMGSFMTHNSFMYG